METMNPNLLKQIADVASDPDQAPITPEVVAAVFAAREAIIEGDPVGTIKKGPDGEVAIRVEDSGMKVWRVNCPDGTQYNDTQPKLPWDEI